KATATSGATKHTAALMFSTLARRFSVIRAKPGQNARPGGMIGIARTLSANGAKPSIGNGARLALFRTPFTAHQPRFAGLASCGLSRRKEVISHPLKRCRPATMLGSPQTQRSKTLKSRHD